MDCRDIRQQLAVYRELSPAERGRLQDHLAGCPGCTATLAAYTAQDRLLSTLPALAPSVALIDAVHSRTIGRRRASRGLSWQRAMVSLSLLLCLGITWSTVSRASGALPGDVLYPVKRSVERFRLALLVDPVARADYQWRLAEMRRAEARAVVEQGRTGQVQFEGELLAIGADSWQVDGVAVAVDDRAWVGAPPPTGSLLAVEAQASGGRLAASRVSVLGPVPAPQPTATAPLSPSRTPTMHRPADEPAKLPSPPPSPRASVTASVEERGPQPSVTVADARKSPRPSVTPAAGGPGPQPADTPGAPGPGPGPSATPSRPGPGPQASTTPDSPGPGPRPSATPTVAGLGPQASHTREPGLQPSATPDEPGPSCTLVTPGPTPQRSQTPLAPEASPQPSHTPVTPVPTPQRSHTPVTPEPTPQPSHTPVTPGPTSQPSHTPVTPGPGPQASVTPGSGPGPSATAGPGLQPSVTSATRPS